MHGGYVMLYCSCKLLKLIPEEPTDCQLQSNAIVQQANSNIGQLSTLMALFVSLIIHTFQLVFQSKQYFSLTTIQPEPDFSATSGKFQQAEYDS